jgi:hypothetical protein
MDACEAFCVAVKFYRSGEWSPALPARNTINVNGRNLTIRQICGLVERITRLLPDSVVSDLFTSMRSRHTPLEKRLVIDRTYALGAGCLLWLMDESEKAVQNGSFRTARLSVLTSSSTGKVVEGCTPAQAV